MWLAIESVKKDCDVVISAGNTGVIVISKLNLKMIENIDKPAFQLYTNKKGMSVV